MPQAAFADSTTASTGQQTQAQDFFGMADELEDIGNILSTLAISSCLAIENRDTPKDFTAGLSNLFDYALQRLDAARQIVRDAKVEPRQPRERSRSYMMREKFIMDAYLEGVPVADISQTLGLASSAVERTIRRLSSAGSNQETENEEAKTA